MTKSFKNNIRRKLAIATWSSPKEGNIYGKLTINAQKSLDYLEKLNSQNTQSNQPKITITHLVGRAVGLALHDAPDINGKILFGRYRPHKTTDLSFIVVDPETHDLSKHKVCEINTKSTLQIAKELSLGAKEFRAGKDQNFKKSMRIVKLLPSWLLRPVLKFTGYLTGALGIDAKILGLEAHPFGGAIITSVGMLGIDEGYPPPTPFARVPIYIVITKIKDRPAAHQGQVIIRPELDIMATIDHRFLDGMRGGQLAKSLRYHLENPEHMDNFTPPSVPLTLTLDTHKEPQHHLAA